MTAIDCKALKKNTFCANIQVSSLKGSNFSWRPYAKTFHPNWVSPCHPFDDVNRVKFCFQSSTHPIYLPICTHFSNTLPHGWLICLSTTRTKANIICIQLDAQKTYKLSPKLSLLETMTWDQFLGEWCLSIQGLRWVITQVSSTKDTSTGGLLAPKASYKIHVFFKVKNII